MPEIQEITGGNDLPVCPHCEKDLPQVKAQRIRSTFGVKFIYYCPHCRKVLGVSHRKGFWMG